MIPVKKRQLVAIILVLIIVGSIAYVLVYSDSWPPVYTVESKSMEHSANWTYGTINTGDLVFVKNTHGNRNNVVTYLQGREQGYSTYGEFGNVILYNVPGKVIIHRAMFYLSWSDGKPVVAGYQNQSWIHITDNAIIMDNVGFTHRNLIVYTSTMTNRSGFITVGDYNLAHADKYYYNSTFNAYEASDQNVFGYNPANASSVVGVAFGQIPWFGLIKLNLMRATGSWQEYNEVPNNAYLFLGITIAVILFAIFFPYEKLGNRRSGKKK